MLRMFAEYKIPRTIASCTHAKGWLQMLVREENLPIILHVNGSAVGLKSVIGRGSPHGGAIHVLRRGIERLCLVIIVLLGHRGVVVGFDGGSGSSDRRFGLSLGGCCGRRSGFRLGVFAVVPVVACQLRSHAIFHSLGDGLQIGEEILVGSVSHGEGWKSVEL